MAAMLGGLPLALGGGVGAELRMPLGITIVGGLIFSQMLTLYTVPVIYLYFDKLAQRMKPRELHLTRTATGQCRLRKRSHASFRTLYSAAGSHVAA